MTDDVQIDFFVNPEFSLELTAYNFASIRVELLLDKVGEDMENLIESLKINDRHMSEAEIPFVGWIHHAGDEFAVYHGSPHKSHMPRSMRPKMSGLQDPYEIIRRGPKVCETIARAVFPKYKELRYYAWGAPESVIKKSLTP